MLSDKLLPESRDNACGNSYQTIECNIHCDPKKKKQAKKSLCRLYIALVVCLIFMSAEFFAGYLSNSVAIFSDAFHMLSDVTGFLFNICGLRLTLRSASSSWTYGYYRVEILAALFSIFLLWIMISIVCLQAADRIRNPPPVDGKLMVIIGCTGMVTNVILTFILMWGEDNEDDDDVNTENVQETDGKQSESGKLASESGYSSTKKKGGNISVESAGIHALGDFVQNIGVLVAGAMIWWDERYFLLDPVCTFFFALLVLLLTTPIVYGAIYTLMETVPKSIDSKALIKSIRDLKYVKELKDIHIWSVNETDNALTAKVDIACTCQCVPVSKVREQITMIAEKRHINHCNIEITVVPIEECVEITCTKSKENTNGQTSIRRKKL